MVMQPKELLSWLLSIPLQLLLPLQLLPLTVPLPARPG